MKKNIIKYLLLFAGVFVVLIIYLSLIGIETDRFNNQIKDKLTKNNNNLDVNLNKIKLTFDPLNFKFNAKTIGAKIIYKNKNIELESIKSQISINSLIKNKIVSSNLIISTKSILLKDLVGFLKVVTKKTELFFLEKSIDKGFAIIDLEFNFDKNGNIKEDYKIRGLLKDGKINLSKDLNFKNITFLLNIENNNINLRDISFTTDKIDFVSNNLKIKRTQQEFFVNGDIENKNSALNKKFLNLLRLSYNFNLENIEISSKNKFSFTIDRKFNYKDLLIDTEISLNKAQYDKPKLFDEYFSEVKSVINFKNHKIKATFKDNNLSLVGSGKIQLEKEFDDINYSIFQSGDKIKFNSKFIFNKISFEVGRINFKNDRKSKLQLDVSGYYIKRNNLVIDELLIKTKDNKLRLKDLLIDKYHRIVKFDEIFLNYFDNEDKKNQIVIKRKQKNNYELNGSTFNANSLISDLLKSKDDRHTRIFKDNINFTLNLKNVYLDNKNVISDLKGNLFIENNKINQANISAIFDDNEKLTFTINTNNNEKITTLFSSRAKPLVKRYKFIKGYEEGYLDFYSSKIGNVSNSRLKIYDFKLKELPALTKLLTLASLQGIADLLSGEGIRFNQMEMIFNNSPNLMAIDELYAIGPAISIMMSGYIEDDKLVSLRGTLVPATTINKTISSIPLLGKILVGDKTGEGVFGVSFKIKGKPKDLKTTVNPIKTLTPRFITRTLEKIKKN